MESDMERCAHISRRLERLATLDSGRLMIYGAAKHKYKTGDVLCEDELVVYETTHGVKLPHEYRAYLKHVGDGGAGPGNGIHRLGQFLIGDIIKTPFVPIRYEETDMLVGLEYWKHVGMVEISSYGCAYDARLIMSGDHAGEIWDNNDSCLLPALSEAWSAFYDEKPPLLSANDTRSTFFNWIEKWIDESEEKIGMFDRGEINYTM